MKEYSQRGIKGSLNVPQEVVEGREQTHTDSISSLTKFGKLHFSSAFAIFKPDSNLDGCYHTCSFSQIPLGRERMQRESERER